MRREEEIAVAFNDYRDALKLSTFGDFEYIDIQEAFEEGAEWADNHPVNVWHDANEKPKDDMDILFISKNGKVHKVSKIDNSLYDWLKDNDGIDKWAYISDLLPKGGEQ